MITLVEHLRNNIRAGFTVNNTRSNKILLFDLDDTLIHTTAEVNIVKNGKVVDRITNAEFNDYVLKPGESYDFAEFNDETILNKSKFTKYWDTLKREYRRGTHIGILTARCDCDLIKRFFLRNGIDIKTDLIMAINDPKLGLSGSIQHRKSEAINILADAGYKLFVFFDDNIPNLEYAKQLERKLDIIVKTVKC